VVLRETLTMPFEVKEVDKRFYNEHLADWLADKIFDIHTHVWLKAFFEETSVQSRGPEWPWRYPGAN